MEIVRTHTVLCAGANFIPVPLLGSVIVGGIQFDMIAALTRCYGIDFDRERGRATLSAAGVAVAHEAVTHTSLAGALGHLTSAVPLIGASLRQLGWPALFGAYTYFLGKSYVDHYEAGGQFADFKPPGLLHSPVTHMH